MLQDVFVRDDMRALTAASTTVTNHFAALWAATLPALQAQATASGTGIASSLAMEQLMAIGMKLSARYLEKLPFVELQLLQLNAAETIHGCVRAKDA